ncbi:lamin tail domain-containing protein [Paenibacillus hamazuiensis]|uniref:lamin tail domain-containing protein n=1 Tax=Paenibacillus hamazuiensis TaxID=2936508 RepID=UPI00200EAEDA|nr:lamin tail domain-containing protein [Paenibacillus hamazuiensis]
MNLKRRLARALSALALTVVIAGSALLPAQHAQAEGPSDPAPVIQPVGTPNGKKVLFDNTHGQTAGAADWVIDGGFSDFANALAGSGYYVKELRKSSPITLTDLQDYDVVVIGEANIPYKTSEQSAMLQYVQNGGSIFFIADHYNADRNKNRWDASEVFNGYRRGAWANPAQGMSAEEAASAAMQDVASSDWLAANFGVRFRYNAIGDVNATNIVAPSQAFNITSGVSSVAVHAGSTLAIIDPNKAKGIVYLPATTAKWANAVDQGVYAGGGVSEGPFAAVSKVGAGKAGFIGDSSPVKDATPKYLREETGGSKTTYDGFKEVDDDTLLVNMVNWLSTHESYTSLSQVAGLTLDQPTPLLSMETPQTSTEPQPEPWAAPAAGYKWWDSSTFKSGSYGYSSGGSGGTGTNVFISEYVEGSSYNKALEIYNGSGAAIDLSAYTIAQSNTSTVISLSGTLNSGSVYVIANPNASSGVLAKANMTSSALSFNGDDSVSLKKNGTVIDVVGTAGTSFGTDKTLVRKSTVTAGSTSYDAAQWDSYAADTFTYLGTHTVQSANHAPVVASPLADRTATAGSGAFTVDASGTFSDQDGDTLTLTASSGNASAATVSVSGMTITVTPLAAGTATITVTANDGKGGTVSDAFVVTVTSAQTVTLSETFESGSKGSYTAGNVTLSSGSWYFDNALIGNLTSDAKNGVQSARVKAAGSIAMNFNVSGAASVKVKHANFGTDTGATWKLQKSLNGGSTWTDVSGTFSSTAALTEQTIAVGESAAVRFRIVVSGTSGSRLNFDDFQIVK